MTYTRRLLLLLGPLCAAMALLSDNATARQATTVFRGIPSIKISEGGVERLPETLPRDKAVNIGCVISKIGDDYYWASRENTAIIRVESGVFITFLAVNGSGYCA
jgi:hypothetical protein